MTSLALWIGVAGVAAVVAIFVAMYALGLYRSRQKGTHGYVQHSRLVCPKCHGTFDYDWIPGGALTAVRLGRARYMACPICRKWSTFNVWDAPTPPPSKQS
jgi:hypothetical protein